jgi:hypothetical protein
MPNTVALLGHLGNQMFQYAFGQGMAATTGQEVQYNFDDVLKSFELAPYGVALTGHRTSPVYTEKSLLYEETVDIHAGSTYFVGYWQNEKYFAHIEDKIRAQFTLNMPHLRPLTEKLANEESVAVGVRRGDYLLPDKQAFHGVLGLSYYAAAYTAIRAKFPNAKFYIFSDDPNWCREHMEGTVLDGDKHEHLYLFSKCQHAIIANSSFHWWGAWLGRCNTIAPREWFRCGVPIDIVPARWLTLPSGYGQ